MKVMKCSELGGACDLEFRGNTFEEIADLSKKHGMEMFQKQDPGHLKAMAEMNELMKNPESMQLWFASKKEQFNSLPEIGE